MSPIFSKLNLSTQKLIFVIDPPDSFHDEISQLTDVEVIDTLKSKRAVAFALIFVTQKKQIDQIAATLAKKIPGDAIVWFAYPKKTSKKYQCDFHRDTGWDAIRAQGFDSVRMVAIDDDWSALRFRRSEFIKRARK
jgi:hypothetical protein